jgi:hypothetical protein
MLSPTETLINIWEFGDYGMNRQTGGLKRVKGQGGKESAIWLTWISVEAIFKELARKIVNDDAWGAEKTRSEHGKRVVPALALRNDMESVANTMPADEGEDTACVAR